MIVEESERPSGEAPTNVHVNLTRAREKNIGDSKSTKEEGAEQHGGKEKEKKERCGKVQWRSPRAPHVLPALHPMRYMFDYVAHRLPCALKYGEGREG